METKRPTYGKRLLKREDRVPEVLETLIRIGLKKGKRSINVPGNGPKEDNNQTSTRLKVAEKNDEKEAGQLQGD